MSGGQVAALVAAGAFLMLVVVLAVPILRLRRTVDAATKALDAVGERMGPLLADVNVTVTNVNEALSQVHTSLDGVNLQLARIDTITGHVQTVSANVANLATVVTAATANPMVKVAAFAYGVRKATAQRRQAEEEREVRETVRAQRRAARRGRKEGSVR
jgi:uncharacterized protein YoxC